MEPEFLLLIISGLSILLFINEYFTSKQLKEKLVIEQFFTSTLEVIGEDMLEKIEELHFEIYELKRQHRLKDEESPKRIVGSKGG